MATPRQQFWIVHRGIILCIALLIALAPLAFAGQAAGNDDGSNAGAGNQEGSGDPENASTAPDHESDADDSPSDDPSDDSGAAQPGDDDGAPGDGDDAGGTMPPEDNNAPGEYDDGTDDSDNGDSTPPPGEVDDDSDDDPADNSTTTNPGNTNSTIPPEQDKGYQENQEETGQPIACSKRCDDDDPCTVDYCDGAKCYYFPKSNCAELEEPSPEIPVEKPLPTGPQPIAPGNFRYALISEFDGPVFSIQTNKIAYRAGEDILTLINAPDDAEVELSFTYNGISQYIKIPKEKSFPMDFLLPVPRNIQEGLYIVRAAMLFEGEVTRAATTFRITSDGTLIPIATTPITDNSILDERGEIFEEKPVEKPKQDILHVPPVEARAALHESVRVESGAGQEPEVEVIGQIEVGKPVRWKKRIVLEGPGAEPLNLMANLPKSAKALKVKEISAQPQAKATGAGIAAAPSSQAEEKKEYIMEFETEPPRLEEKQPVEKDGTWRKKVIISSDPEYEGIFEYTNVLSHAGIEEANQENISLYWMLDGESVDATDNPDLHLEFTDTNGNGRIDRLSWITPHLSTQEFEVVIQLSTGTSSDGKIAISTIKPDGTHYRQGSGIAFQFLVNYNKSTTLSCDLSVDGAAIQNMMVTDGQENITTANKTFSEGQHAWNAACTDTGGNVATGLQKQFTVDLTPPAVTLLNTNAEVSLVDSIALSFVPNDNYASLLTCDLYINTLLNTSSLAVSDEATKSITLAGLENGTYSWRAECNDTAGNRGVSATQTFIIDTKRDFSVSTDKETYQLGEGGIFIITAPLGGTVTVVFTSPKSTTTTRTYTGPYPVIDNLDFLDYPGIWQVAAYLNYAGAVRQVNDTFEVASNFEIFVNVDRSKAVPAETITFAASASGGLGDLTYSWDFGDLSDAASGKVVSHSYAKVGQYQATLAVTDSKGNKLTKTQGISIEERYAIVIQVADQETGAAIVGATLHLVEGEKQTNSAGQASYDLFVGDYSVLIEKEGYQQAFTYIEVAQAATFTLLLKKAPLAANAMASTRITPLKLASPDAEQQEDLTAPAPAAEEQLEGNALALAHDTIAMAERIEEAMKSYNSLEPDAKKIAEAFSVRLELEKADSLMGRIDRDLHNLEQNRRELTEGEKQREIDKLNGEIAFAWENLVTGITIAEKQDAALLASDDSIEAIIDDYLANSNLTIKEKDKKRYVQQAEELQADFAVRTQVLLATVEYLSGRHADITAVVHDLSFPQDAGAGTAVISIQKT